MPCLCFLDDLQTKLEEVAGGGGGEEEQGGESTSTAGAGGTDADGDVDMERGLKRPHGPGESGPGSKKVRTSASVHLVSIHKARVGWGDNWNQFMSGLNRNKDSKNASIRFDPTTRVAVRRARKRRRWEGFRCQRTR